MCYTPYEICYGRKYRFIKNLNRPLVVIFNTNLCNVYLKDKAKAKISFLQLVIRLFYKDCLGFRIKGFFKNHKSCKLAEGDVINLVCHATKAVLRKLLLRLNYVIDDYKLIKRRKYTLNFTFYIIKSEDSIKMKEVDLDIVCNENDNFSFFVIVSSFYAKDLLQMLFFFYLEECGEMPFKVDEENTICDDSDTSE